MSDDTIARLQAYERAGADVLLTWVAVDAMADAAEQMLDGGDLSSLKVSGRIGEWLGG